MWNRILHSFIHHLFGFSHAKAADSIAIEPDTTQGMSALFPQILIDAALNNAEKLLP
jgi:hypothetical protein